MKPIELDHSALRHFPEGAKLVEMGAPTGMEELIASAMCVKTDEPPYEATYYFFLEFENHEEWKDFQKSRKIVLRLRGSVVPFNVGVVHEDNNIRLQQEGNGQHLN